jgi:hypothetical protein
MADFPAVGHSYLVDFQKFKVKLSFTSITSLSYTVVNPDGSAGQQETVTIRVESIGTQLFLVTWQESDKTTVVHIEDYVNNTIITNITNPPDLKFEQYHGTFTAIDGAVSGAPLTYAHDIRPMFRDQDIACMTPKQIKLGDPAWMCIAANAQRVFDVLQAGVMPPDGKWPDDKLTTFKNWMDGGLLPGTSAGA